MRSIRDGTTLDQLGERGLCDTQAIHLRLDELIGEGNALVMVVGAAGASLHDGGADVRRTALEAA